MFKAAIQSEDTCLLCGDSNWIYRFKFGEFYLRQCQNCGLGQTYPIPTKEQQSQINESTYTIEQRIKTYRARRRELIKRYRRQLRQIEQLQIKPGKKLLDVGCSLGFFLSVARDQGYEVYGVEVSEETGKYAREDLGLDVFLGTLEEAQYPNDSFDIITLWDVVEHVFNPINLLGEARRVLKDNGILVVQSPNMESVMARLAGERWNWWTVPDHLYHFTVMSMTRLLELCGFRVAAYYTWEPSRDLLYNLFVAGLRLQPVSGGYKEKLLRRIAHLVSRVAWPTAVPFQKMAWQREQGALIVICGRKTQSEHD